MNLIQAIILGFVQGATEFLLEVGDGRGAAPRVFVEPAIDPDRPFVNLCDRRLLALNGSPRCLRDRRPGSPDHDGENRRGNEEDGTAHMGAKCIIGDVTFRVVRWSKGSERRRAAQPVCAWRHI